MGKFTDTCGSVKKLEPIELAKLYEAFLDKYDDTPEKITLERFLSVIPLCKKNWDIWCKDERYSDLCGIIMNDIAACAIDSAIEKPQRGIFTMFLLKTGHGYQDTQKIESDTKLIVEFKGGNGIIDEI